VQFCFADHVAESGGPAKTPWTMDEVAHRARLAVRAFTGNLTLHCAPCSAA
jgi:hypothetical protein